MYLLASVLERFLGLYVSMNSFCVLVARTRQRKELLRAVAATGGMEAAAVIDPVPVPAVAPPPPEDGAAGGATAPLAPLEAAERALAAEPTAFGFFQAVRTLERLRPGRARIGRFADPGDEVVRFGVHPSIAFPPSECTG